MATLQISVTVVDKLIYNGFLVVTVDKVII
jgi:hypothetical protein